MNKKIRLALVALFISVLPSAIFSSCDKDTNCYLDVAVYNGSSSKTVPGALVQIYQAACDSTDYNYTVGHTGDQGIFSTSFNAPAILHVKATMVLDTINYLGVGCRVGEATVRIAEGDTKVCDIHVLQDTMWVTDLPAL